MFGLRSGTVDRVRQPPRAAGHRASGLRSGDLQAIALADSDDPDSNHGGVAAEDLADRTVRALQTGGTLLIRSRPPSP